MRDKHLRDIVGKLALSEDFFKFGGGGLGGCFVVELGYNRFAEKNFCLLRMYFFGIEQLGDLFGFKISQQAKVVFHHIIGDAHDLTEHIAGLVGYADVIAFGFAHFFFAVEADEDWHSHYNLGWLSVRTLDVSADKVIEGLVCSAELDVTLYDNGIITLHERV